MNLFWLAQFAYNYLYESKSLRLECVWGEGAQWRHTTRPK